MKDEKFDRLFREAMDGLDGRPPQAHHWNMESTYQKIQQQLNPATNNRFPGIFDLAAAVVALLLAVGYLIGSFVVEHAQNPALEAVANFFEEQQATAPPPAQAKQPTFSPIQRKTLLEVGNQAVPPALLAFEGMGRFQALPANETAFLGIANYSLRFNSGKMGKSAALGKASAPVSALLKNGQVATVVKKQHPNRENQVGVATVAQAAHPSDDTPKKFKISVPVGAGVVGDRFMPVVGVRATFKKPTATVPTKYTSFAAAVNAYPSFHFGEGDGMEVQNTTFVEGAVGRGNIANDIFTGFEVGAGLLIQSNDTRFQKGTIKINYTIKIKEKLRVTPEVILTDNFSKPLPGIKLTLG